MTGKHYQVWITLEEWDGDNKIWDAASHLVANIKNENKAMHLWATLEGIAISLKESLQVFFKAKYDD